MAKQRRSICPLACMLDLIGDKWTLLVIRDIACGTTHFNDLCRSPEKIATNILTVRLEHLQESGLVERIPSATRPGRDEYRLTGKGKSLQPVLAAMAAWGLKHIKGTNARLTPTFD